MHPAIQERVDHQRGCGWRKEGGMYLVCNEKASSCGKLPVSLEKLNHCPHCHEALPPGYGLRISRAPRMLEQPWHLWKDLKCKTPVARFLHVDSMPALLCGNCPLRDGYKMPSGLLILVGEKFYRTPQEYMQETIKQGISRRINVIPEGFKIGETYCLLAHIKAVHTGFNEIHERDGKPLLVPEIEETYAPGIFAVFRPTAIEYVVKGDETDEQIDSLLKRGIVPVNITRFVDKE